MCGASAALTSPSRGAWLKTSPLEVGYAPDRMEISRPGTEQTHAPAPLEAELAASVVTPALVIDLAAARRNLRAVLERTAGPGRWRPHVKTAKVPEVMALFVEEGVRRFKCATLREAEVLGGLLESGGGGDVLLAHHLYGPALERLAEIARAHPAVRFSTLVESVEQVVDVPTEAGIFVDLDLGMHRTGASLSETRPIAVAAGERLRGLHAYDGHRHEADLEERRRLVHAGYDELARTVTELQAAGIEVPEVITAGTPAFPAALEHPGLATLPGTIHRVSPGTVVYHDLRSTAQNPGLPAEFAATVLTRVASLPGEDRFTCDAGSKAIEAASPDMIAAALEHPAARCLGQSEEHTVFRAEGERPARGTLLRLVPGHVCPTVNLAEEAILVEDGKLVARVPVTARGHGPLH